MLKRKAFNRIFFSTLIFFVVFALYNFKFIMTTSESNDKSLYNKEILYTLNADNYVSSVDVYVGKFFTLEDRIKEKLEIITSENDKNSFLPSYFKPILPENTKVLDVVVKDSLVKVNFSKEFENINEEQSEKLIEAIIYTIVDENIIGVEIYVEGELLKYVPHTNKELPTILNHDFGINKVYDVFSYSDNISKVVINYYSHSNDQYYMIPVTKYVNDDRELLDIIFDDYVNSFGNLITLFENIKINEYSINKNKIIVDFDNNLDIYERDLVFSSIFNNYDVKTVELLVNGEKKYEKTLKKY